MTRGVRANPGQIRAGAGHGRGAVIAGGPGPSGTEARVDKLYRVARTWMNRLGGGEGVQGTYGTLAPTSAKQVMQALAQHTGMNRGSKFVDVGAGLGQPQLHAAVSPGVERARGFEIDPVKVDKGTVLIKEVCRELGIPGAPPALVKKDIADVQRIDDTHIFSFWQGISTEDRLALGRLAAADRNLKGIAVMSYAIKGETPVQYMEGLGFPPLSLKASFPVKMGNRGFTAYVFRVNPR